MGARSRYTASTAALLLGVLPLALAHGSDDHDDMATAIPWPSRVPDNATFFHQPAYLDQMRNHTSAAPTSYFHHSELSDFIVAHIALMIIGWLFILPISEFCLLFGH